MTAKKFDINDVLVNVDGNWTRADNYPYLKPEKKKQVKAPKQKRKKNERSSVRS